MPVRSLRSHVLKWPDRKSVDSAARRWAAEAVIAHPETLQIGYFGSYAKGTWGVGSDLDIVVIVRESDLPFLRRPTRWDTTTLPVPADILVYTLPEWTHSDDANAFREGQMRDTVWVYTVFQQF